MVTKRSLTQARERIESAISRLNKLPVSDMTALTIGDIIALDLRGATQELDYAISVADDA